MQRLPSLLAVLGVLSGALGCTSESGENGRAGQGAGAAAGASAGQATGAGPSGVGGSGGAPSAAGASSDGGSSLAGGNNSDAGSAGSSSSAGSPGASGSPVVFVGGFGSAPVQEFDLDKTTGALTLRPQTIDAGPEPTCLALDASGKHLYVCNEDEQGSLTSYAIDPDGSVTFVNHQSGSDQGFTSLAIHPSGKFIAGASYGGGSASVFPLAADGSVGAELSVSDFGDAAQSHCVVYDPTGQYLLVTTKGTNAVQQLLQSEAGLLTTNAPASVASAGAPRHLAVHPNGKLAFVVAERGSTVTSYQLSADGKLSESSSVSSLPGDYDGQNTGAHVELSADGHVLYVSNRGHNSIGVFSVDQVSGALTLIEHEPSRGDAPHDFDIDPQGEILIAGHRRSGTLTAFKIAADGSLSPLGESVAAREDVTAVLIAYPK